MSFIAVLLPYFLKKIRITSQGVSPYPPPIIFAPPFQVNTSLFIPPLWSCVICLNFFFEEQCSLLYYSTDNFDRGLLYFLGQLWNQLSSRSLATWELKIVYQKWSSLTAVHNRLGCPLLKLSLIAPINWITLRRKWPPENWSFE